VNVLSDLAKRREWNVRLCRKRVGCKPKCLAIGFWCKLSEHVYITLGSPRCDHAAIIAAQMAGTAFGRPGSPPILN
jgi:hypothetical protein